MELATSGKTGNGKVIEYKEQDSGDDDQTKEVTKEVIGTSFQSEDDRGEPPMKKLRSGLGTLPLPSPSSTSKALQESGSDDDDYETSHNKKRKPRKSFTSTNKGKGKGKGRARLHALFDKLPTDVIYTLFSHLHPSDLLRLARTSRMLRSHLMSRSSASVWKEAREGVEPPVPDCPPDQSEPQWAYLLFSRDCSTCERTNIPYVDYRHRLRLCSKCDDPGVVLIIGSKAKNAFPHILDVKMLLELLPYSNTGSSSTGKYYRVKGIEDIGAEWAAMRERSEAEIQEFKNRKQRETEDIMTHAALCESWNRDRTILNKKQLYAKREARQNEILSRLEELGHDPRDVRHSQVTYHSIFNTSAALTKKSWEIIRPQLEAVVENVKTQRLQRERNQIIAQRQALAKSVLKNYEVPTDVPRAFWRPLEGFISSASSFFSIIYQQNEVSVTASDFQPALDDLPVLLAIGARTIHADLLQRMMDGGAPDIKSSSPELNPGKICLATSIFWCRSNNRGLPVCGLDSLASHRCRGPSTFTTKYSCLYYDHPASNLVAALLAVANLDPSTTAEQMDDLDLRFHCPSWENPSGRLALNWRDALRTYVLARWFSQVEASNQLRSGPWEVFSPEETAAIKEKEMANIGDERLRFRCKTCADAGWIRRRELEHHLQTCHSIVDHPNPTTEFHLHPRRPPQPVTFDASERPVHS